jgi:type IV pilus assembly protein PilW
MQRVYYIASCDDCTGSGDGIPTLKRLEYINGTAQILSVAEGIENMQFEYGQDTDGDGVPDTYFSDTSTISSALPAAWAQITAIKVNLLGRDLTSTGGYTDTRTYKLGPVTITTPSDGYKRTLNASTVRLNNVAGRLE